MNAGNFFFSLFFSRPGAWLGLVWFGVVPFRGDIWALVWASRREGDTFQFGGFDRFHLGLGCGPPTVVLIVVIIIIIGHGSGERTGFLHSSGSGSGKTGWRGEGLGGISGAQGF